MLTQDFKLAVSLINLSTRLLPDNNDVQQLERHPPPRQRHASNVYAMVEWQVAQELGCRSGGLDSLQ